MKKTEVRSVWSRMWTGLAYQGLVRIMNTWKTSRRVRIGWQKKAKLQKILSTSCWREETDRRRWFKNGHNSLGNSLWSGRDTSPMGVNILWIMDTFVSLWRADTNHASVRELLTIREFYALRVKLMRGCKWITSPNVSRGRREILSFTGKSPELECMDQWMQTKSKSEKRYKDSESCAIDKMYLGFASPDEEVHVKRAYQTIGNFHVFFFIQGYEHTCT